MYGWVVQAVVSVKGHHDNNGLECWSISELSGGIV